VQAEEFALSHYGEAVSSPRCLSTAVPTCVFH
jgi:hypothetical protein